MRASPLSFYNHSNMKQFIEDVTAILENAYPDKYDIVNNTEDISIIIHFPQFTISNSKGYSRQMYDMMVSFKCNDKKITGGLRGTRLTYAYDELICSYVHSHLRSKLLWDNNDICTHNAVDLGPFCLGSSEFAAMQADLYMKMDLRKLEMFLFFIETYLQWESLEGGPYHRMENITIGGRHQSYGPSTREISDTKMLVYSNLADLPFKLETYGTRKFFKIDNNDPRLLDVISNLSTVRAYTKGDTGLWYRQPPDIGGPLLIDYEAINAEAAKGGTFRFKGNDIPVKILVPPKEESAAETDYVHMFPKTLLNYTVNDINRELTAYLFNNELFK
jgi:hypothetical protein